MTQSWSRRDLLRLSGAGIAFLAGCVNDQPAGNPSTTDTTPTQTTTATPSSSPTSTQTPHPSTASTPEEVPVVTPPACDGSLTRLNPSFDSVTYDRLDGFELTASADTVALGEDIAFTLRWVESTGETPETGNDEQFTIDRKTDSGWQSIYRVSGTAAWTGIAKSLVGNATPPSEWFEWSFTATQEGLAHSTQFNTPYAVCDPLTPGAYRFVLWGVGHSESESGTTAIGAQFRITE